MGYNIVLLPGSTQIHQSQLWVVSRKTVQGEAGAEARQAEGQESEAQPSSGHGGGLQIRGVNRVVTCAIFNVLVSCGFNSGCFIHLLAQVNFHLDS